jgi:ATP-dependent DNA helicase DinG
VEAAQAGRNAFADLSVPAAAITIKQGVGRLIRTGRDRGIVAVLDRRLVTRRYGRAFLGSLPQAPPHPVADARRWWDLPGAGGGGKPSGDVGRAALPRSS